MAMEKCGSRCERRNFKCHMHMYIWLWTQFVTANWELAKNENAKEKTRTNKGSHITNKHQMYTGRAKREIERKKRVFRLRKMQIYRNCGLKNLSLSLPFTCVRFSSNVLEVHLLMMSFGLYAYTTTQFSAVAAAAALKEKRAISVNVLVNVKSTLCGVTIIICVLMPIFRAKKKSDLKSIEWLLSLLDLCFFFSPSSFFHVARFSSSNGKIDTILCGKEKRFFSLRFLTLQRRRFFLLQFLENKVERLCIWIV